MRYEIFADFWDISFMKIGNKGTVFMLGLNETLQNSKGKILNKRNSSSADFDY